MKRKEETGYDGRLAQLAAGWFQKAKTLDVCLQYEFTGISLSPGREEMLEAVDGLVTRAIRASGAAPDREDRWLTITVDRQPNGARLVCVSSAGPPAGLSDLAVLGAAVSLRQCGEICELTAFWKSPETPRSIREENRHEAI